MNQPVNRGGGGERALLGLPSCLCVLWVWGLGRGGVRAAANSSGGLGRRRPAVLASV